MPPRQVVIPPLPVEQFEPSMRQVLIDAYIEFRRAPGPTPKFPPTWRTACLTYFDRYPTSVPAAEALFNSVAQFWRLDFRPTMHPYATAVWQEAVAPAIEWEAAAPGRHVHKGSPYYFWAMAAIELGDMDAGYLLAHRSFMDDCTTTGHDDPQNPALFLVTIDHARTGQANRDWVLKKAAFVERRLAACTTAMKGGLTLDAFRERFLAKTDTRDLSFVFAYTVARLVRLAELPPHVATSSFASQSESQLLFSLAYVLEETVRRRNGNVGLLAEQAKRLLTEAGSTLTQADSDQLNADFKADFDAALKRVIDRSYRTASGTSLTDAERAIFISYRVRNRAGHDPRPSPIIVREFQLVEQALFDALFLAVEKLYPA